MIDKPTAEEAYPCLICLKAGEYDGVDIMAARFAIKSLYSSLEAAEAQLKEAIFQRNTAYRLLSEKNLLDYDLIMAKRPNSQE